MSIRISLLPVALMICMTLPALCQQTASAPALPADMQQAVRQAVQDLSADKPAQREAAQKRLRALMQGVVEEVARAQTADPEQLSRLTKVFDDLNLSIRLQQLMLGLSDSERKTIQDLAVSNRDLFDDLMSRDEQKASAAFDKLVVKADDAVISPLVMWGLRHETHRMRLVALKSVALIKKPSPMIGEILIARVLSQKDIDLGLIPGSTHEEILLNQKNLQLTAAEFALSLKTLVALKDERVLPVLIELALGRHDMTADKTVVFELLVSFNDKRVIKTLASQVMNDTPLSHVTANNVTVICYAGDLAMHMVLKMTEQSTEDYGFVTSQFIRAGAAGFSKGEQRQAARDKFAKWWQDHKKDYEKVEALEVNIKPLVPVKPK